MEKEFSIHDSIFQTQLNIKLTPYEHYLREVKSYTQNLNSHLQGAFNDQNKSIKRKKIQLQSQLQYLRDKYFNERKKVRQMEDYFVENCQNVIKNDVKKWEHHQIFFNELFQHYRCEIQIQSLINQRNRQKIRLLKKQVRQNLKQGIKRIVSERLQSKESSHNKKIRSIKSLSVKSQVKMKTEASEYTRPTYRNQSQNCEFNVRKINKSTQMDQSKLSNSLLIQQRSIRMKTEISLPSLKKSSVTTAQKFVNNDFNFLKPIGTLRKSQKQNFVLPQIVKLFKFYHQDLQSHSKSSTFEMDWFQKVVFNNRNFQKIISHFQQQCLKADKMSKSKYSQSVNPVKELVAKNLFRLKAESTSTKSNNKLKQRSLLSINQKRLPLNNKFLK